MFDNLVICSRCHTQCTAKKARVQGKRAGTRQCQQCDCTFVKISVCLKGEVMKMKDWSDEENVASFNEIPSKFVSARKVYAQGGNFLPLGVLAQQGYPVDVNESKSIPENVRPHPLFAFAYRVPIEAMGVEHAEEERHTKSMRASTDHALVGAAALELFISDKGAIQSQCFVAQVKDEPTQTMQAFISDDVRKELCGYIEQDGDSFDPVSGVAVD